MLAPEGQGRQSLAGWGDSFDAGWRSAPNSLNLKEMCPGWSSEVLQGEAVAAPSVNRRWTRCGCADDVWRLRSSAEGGGALARHRRVPCRATAGEARHPALRAPLRVCRRARQPVDRADHPQRVAPPRRRAHDLPLRKSFFSSSAFPFFRAGRSPLCPCRAHNVEGATPPWAQPLQPGIRPSSANHAAPRTYASDAT